MEIGQKLKTYRLSIGQRKKRMQKVCGLTSMTITNIEKDLVSPTLNTLEKICDCLGLQIKIVDKEGNNIL